MKFTQLFLMALMTMLVMSSCGSKNDVDLSLIPVSAGDNSGSNGSYEFINKEGKIMINPQFSDAGLFRGGLALVRTSGDDRKYGFINKDGKYVINASYKEATSFNEGLAWVVKENGAPEAITKDGKTAFTLKQADEVRIFTEGLAAFSVVDSAGTKWGFTNKDGEIVINPQFSRCGYFSDGLCAVRNKEGKWGFIDKKGTLKINHQFQEASMFSNKMAVVESGGKTGAIDKDGKFVINPQFTNMVSDGKLFKVNQDGKWGWCDESGKFIINPQFEAAGNFGDADLAAVKSGKDYGYIDREGKYVINPQFSEAMPFVDGIAAVANGTEEVGFIDKTGKFVINPQFKGISRDYYYYSNGAITAYATVETDLFDISVVTSRINLESPEGLQPSSTMSDAAVKFGKSSSDFSLYSTEHKLLADSRLNRDISMDFYVLGDASKNEMVSTGYYAYENKVFNPTASITGFAYAFNISGKGIGKEKSTVEAIDKMITGGGYRKDESLSSSTDYSSYSLYAKGSKQVIIKWENSVIYLVIYPQGGIEAPAPVEVDSSKADW